MEQLDFFDVPSPCIGVCSTDEKGYCKGCMRNRQERFGWQQLSNQEKLNVIKLCRRRYRRKQTEKNKKTTPPENIPAAPINPDDTQPDLF